LGAKEGISGNFEDKQFFRFYAKTVTIPDFGEH